MEPNKAALRGYLAQIAQEYAKSEDDPSLRVRIMQDFDRLLQGLAPVNPFYTWDALGVLRYDVIPASDTPARAAVDALYVTVEQHFMEEARSCRSMSISDPTAPPSR